MITIQQIFLDFQLAICDPVEGTFLKRILDMLQHSYFAEYELYCQKMLKYRKTPAPLKLIEKFETALTNLRRHLHQNRIFMPMAKYPYDPEDITTHGYISNPDLRKAGCIPNPFYKYKDCWTRVDGLKGLP